MKQVLKASTKVQYIFLLTLLLVVLINFFHTSQIIQIILLAFGLVSGLFTIATKSRLPDMQEPSECHPEPGSGSTRSIESSPRFPASGLYAILAIIVFAGLMLRLWNLTILGPYFDESHHLLAGKHLLESGVTDYTRALIVSWSVALFYWIGSPSSFNEYLFFGRVPGAIFGALTAVPLYFLAKRISKPVAIISAVLWATSPWAIAVSRNIREYAYYPFLILIVVLVFIKLMELLVDFQRENLKKILVYALLIFFFIFYAYSIDTLSTLKLSFIIFPPVFVYLLLANTKKTRSVFQENRKYLIALPIMFILLACFSIIAAINGSITFDYSSADKNWFYYFMKPADIPMHWWHYISFYHIAYFFVSIGTICAFIGKKKEYFMHLFIFTVFILFFMFFFDFKYTLPRYIYYALPFFTIIIANGLYSVFFIVRNIFTGKNGKYISTGIIILFVISVFDLRNTFYPLTSDTHGFVLTTGQYHYDVSGMIEFLEDNIKEDDYYVATKLDSSILQLNFNVSEDKIYFYYLEKKRFKKVKEFIKDKERGFIVLDYMKNDGLAKWYPKHRKVFYIGDTPARLVYRQKEILIYKWENR